MYVRDSQVLHGNCADGYGMEITTGHEMFCNPNRILKISRIFLNWSCSKSRQMQSA